VARTPVRYDRRIATTLDSPAAPVSLADVTFVVLDLETTGCAPGAAAITEVGAVKYRAGVCEGELQTLVNPGGAIPAFIAGLTGITDGMVSPAPPIAAVLPSVLEFVGRAVVVGHNVRFDLAFLGAALAEHGYPPLACESLDTVALARRLMHDETPNLRLQTLAHHIRTERAPIHRALDDARATADLLHVLLERAGTLGVLTLDDLLAVPAVAHRHELAKLKLAARVPRRPGVLVFRDVRGRVLHVGRATNLRARVLDYFAGDDRQVCNLLRQTCAIEHLVCTDPVEIALRAVRLVAAHDPPFNRRPKARKRARRAPSPAPAPASARPRP
jgi:DNA polymerase-3 subunit epsilon